MYGDRYWRQLCGFRRQFVHIARRVVCPPDGLLGLQNAALSAC